MKKKGFRGHFIKKMQRHTRNKIASLSEGVIDSLIQGSVESAIWLCGGTKLFLKFQLQSKHAFT